MGAHAISRLAWLALLCTLLHAAMPSVHAIAPPDSMQRTLALQLGQLCSQQTDAPHDGDSLPATPPCLLCLAGAHLALSGPSFCAVAPTPYVQYAQRAASRLPVGGAVPYLYFSSRAPPRGAHSLYSERGGLVPLPRDMPAQPAT
ncbi:hypothetical protein PIGHUM_02412 [Pigmentiphaga humi]|uniref:DUF2946 domain-containing protein n=1 Tax=Pigmentiphaga humi TaxID=2478468 RepID=A0A3P4B360_9BURK|nr:hypothetical protein [Pigmentiphaga humi]VCU70341.1 hypothetical protein PIGHUM_02412 [Pigmentiphaga humi]